MPSRVYWIDHPWILSVDFSGQVTPADVKSAAQECLAAVQHQPVYFIIDMAEAQSVAPAVLELPTFSEWIYHPNARWFAYVHPPGLFKSLIQVRQRDTGKLFNDRQSALDFLHRAVQYATRGS
jgi:tricorn protease-like protein